MVIKITMILILIAALFFPALYSGQSETIAATENAITTNRFLMFGMALKAASFSYGGYQQTINFGEEVQNPQRVMPRGIIMGIFVIIILYLSVNYSYYRIVGFNELKTSRGIAAIVVEKMFGESGKYIFSVLLFISVLAYVNVLLLSNPRVMYAMSLDGILPAAFRKKEEKKDVLTRMPYCVCRNLCDRFYFLPTSLSRY
jgi:APA family basic amino acid/polyamine antiporter